MESRPRNVGVPPACRHRRALLALAGALGALALAAAAWLARWPDGPPVGVGAPPPAPTAAVTVAGRAVAPIAVAPQRRREIKSARMAKDLLDAPGLAHRRANEDAPPLELAARALGLRPGHTAYDCRAAAIRALAPEWREDAGLLLYDLLRSPHKYPRLTRLQDASLANGVMLYAIRRDPDPDRAGNLFLEILRDPNRSAVIRDYIIQHCDGVALNPKTSAAVRADLLAELARQAARTDTISAGTALLALERLAAASPHGPAAPPPPTTHGPAAPPPPADQQGAAAPPPPTVPQAAPPPIPPSTIGNQQSAISSPTPAADRTTWTGGAPAADHPPAAPPPISQSTIGNQQSAISSPPALDQLVAAAAASPEFSPPVRSTALQIAARRTQTVSGTPASPVAAPAGPPSTAPTDRRFSSTPPTAASTDANASLLADAAAAATAAIRTRHPVANPAAPSSEPSPQQ